MSMRPLSALGSCVIALACGCHTVRIESDPPGALAYWDGKYYGRTPIVHTWYLGQKAYGFDTKMVLPGYDVSECPPIERGYLVTETSLSTAPSGAMCYVDGVFVGSTPGFHHLRFPRLIRVVWPKEVLANSKYRPEGAPGFAAPAAAKPRVGSVRSRFAVLVGLSRYKFRGKWGLSDLRYAGADAKALAAYLRSERGGRFDHVILLTDEQATTRNIKIAIREKLRGAQRDDLIVISWSGHGGPDPQEPKKLYLITHDTDPAHMASTAYGMDEFKRDVSRLEARRMLILADTCHSAGISDPQVGLRGPKDNKIVEGIKGVYVASAKSSATPPMWMIFTSCEAREYSRETEKLGTGHGVFTWYLLQGLKGGADTPKCGGDGDGRVTLGEVIEYTRDQVKRYTGNQQHPDTAGRFDRTLLMGTAK